MTLSRTTYRIVILLLLLAGILLLRKPVFGQTITAAPTRSSVVIEGVAPANKLTSADAACPTGNRLQVKFP